MLYHNPTLTPYHHHQAKQDACQEIDASSSSSYYHTVEKPNCNYDECSRNADRSCGHEYGVEIEYDTDSTLDKIQWQAWLDEVRNLIVYAGLLSAIVTPFIIESNKKLKPNAEEAVVSLLAHIVSSSSTSSSHYSSDDTYIPPLPSLPLNIPIMPSIHELPFTPNPAYIRANTFWLVSLIFSLTVILVGSLVIQWLRACRSYSLPSFSVASGGQRPLSPLFKLNFESKFTTPTTPTSPTTPTTRRAGQGPEKWHLRMVLATLPLFLQLAVVLFLGGLMDFVQVFGDCAVLVSVSVMVVFALYIWRMGGLQ